MKAEYIKRHDEIWPELVDLLHKAGVSDYDIWLDEETNLLFGILTRTDNHHMADDAARSDHEALVGAHARHHGEPPRQFSRRRAADARLPHGLTGGHRRHRYRQDQRQGGAGRSRAPRRDRRAQDAQRRAARRPLSALRRRPAVDLHPRQSSRSRAQRRASTRSRSRPTARPRRSSTKPATSRCRSSTTSTPGRIPSPPTTTASARPSTKPARHACPIGLNLGAQLYWQQQSLPGRMGENRARS